VTERRVQGELPSLACGMWMSMTFARHSDRLHDEGLTTTVYRAASLAEAIGTAVAEVHRVAPLSDADPRVRRVLARDHGCVGPRIGLDGPCLGAIELDHIRASHAMGKKSETAEHNLVSLCGRHHLVRTENGRWIRPLLVAYVEEASR
jgi:hypothetical protein